MKKKYFLSYPQLLVTAFDSGNPDLESTEAVQISIKRNLNTPVIALSSFVESLYEYEPVGTSVLQVSARDDDITVSIFIGLALKLKKKVKFVFVLVLVLVVAVGVVAGWTAPCLLSP